MDNRTKSGISIAHLNSGSLLAPNKFEMFKTQVEQGNIDIFGVSETWLTEAIPDGLIKLECFNVARLDRSWNDQGIMGDPKKEGRATVLYKQATSGLRH